MERSRTAYASEPPWRPREISQRPPDPWTMAPARASIPAGISHLLAQRAGEC